MRNFSFEGEFHTDCVHLKARSENFPIGRLVDTGTHHTRPEKRSQAPGMESLDYFALENESHIVLQSESPTAETCRKPVQPEVNADEFTDRGELYALHLPPSPALPRPPGFESGSGIPYGYWAGLTVNLSEAASSSGLSGAKAIESVIAIRSVLPVLVMSRRSANGDV